jgi:ribosomal protein L11 methyltransferase
MKAPFLGIELAPYWRILPSSAEPPECGRPLPLIRIDPEHCFGDGSHETTQLCLLGLGHLLRCGFAPKSAVDFGSGSGILALAVAGRGARVEAVENDLSALEVARKNARLASVDQLVDCRERLSEPAIEVDLVLANVITPVLLAFAGALCARQSRAGRMILSGMLPTDVPAVLARYEPLLRPMRPQLFARGEWRALLFAP